MSRRARLVALAAAGLLSLATGGPAAAARVRYHYGADPRGGPALQPPQTGERLTLRGWLPYDCPPPRATHLVCFRHPCTGRTVSVPLRLSLSTPRMEYGPTRVVYNYGSDTIEIQFFPDGSADVSYNSGLLREP